MTVFGIDVSRYQGSVDWVKVYNSGIRFATIKASEGTPSQTATATVDHFRREFPKAKAAGLTVGAYHVILGSSVTSQIDWYLRQLTAVNASPRDIIVQWDYEKWSYAFPSYATLKACIDEMDRRTGVRGVMYTGKWVWDQVTGDPANAALDLRVPLWDSNYGTNPSVSFLSAYPGDTSSRWRGYGGWPVATVLQYGSNTIVPGVTGGCDANAFRGGTLADFRKIFIASASATPAGLFTDLDLY